MLCEDDLPTYMDKPGAHAGELRRQIAFCEAVLRDHEARCATAPCMCSLHTSALSGISGAFSLPGGEFLLKRCMSAISNACAP